MSEVAVSEGAKLQEMDAKLKTILPAQYRECYEQVQPVSMGSAGLKFDASGRVAWDEIWGGFCDLAMAGGPPHRGTLLEPATAAQIEADPRGYRKVTEELCRGIRMVTNLAVDVSPDAGWIQLFCADAAMAGWMVRAIVIENISARAEGSVVKLPAGPHFRLEKEIKNVITSVAKTAHYFVEHMSQAQKGAIAELFTAPPLQPGAEFPSDAFSVLVSEAAGLQAAELQTYRGWLGLQCPNVREAIWMMRALAVNDVVARRQETILYIPVDLAADATGERLAAAVSSVRRLCLERFATATVQTSE